MDGEGSLDFFKRYTDILKHLEDKNNQTRKTSLSSLFILTGLREYQSEMQSIMKKVNEEYKELKMNQKQKDNWISTEEIKEKYDSISAIAISMLNKKEMMNESRSSYSCVSYLEYLWLHEDHWIIHK